MWKYKKSKKSKKWKSHFRIGVMSVTQSTQLHYSIKSTSGIYNPFYVKQRMYFCVAHISYIWCNWR